VAALDEWGKTLIDSVERVFFGKREVIEKMLVAVLCRGHILLEDVPGVGKTILARAFAASMSGTFSRIQCTPDLLPADVLGVSVYQPKDGTFVFREGPIQANLVLVDEINRATPRTQSALLEAMAENQVSVEGKQKPLPDPFLLIATENPVEFEGTFPLPEAQKDRFLFCLGVGYPTKSVEQRIVESQRRITHPVTDVDAVTSPADVSTLQGEVVKIHVEQSVLDYVLSLVEESRKHPSVRIGVSPRGTLALYKSSQALAALRGRDYVVPDDVKELAPAVFLKRLILKPDAAIKGETSQQVIDAILDRVEVPILSDA
jgi:MoxR-like ATPase